MSLFIAEILILSDLFPERQVCRARDKLPEFHFSAYARISLQLKGIVHILPAANMARHASFHAYLFLCLLLPFSLALKFDLAAHTGHSNKYERCIRNFVAKDTLVLVTAIVDGRKGDGQQVNMHVRLSRHMDNLEESFADAVGAGRSKMQWAMNTDGRRTSLERQGWRSHLMPTRLLTFVSRTSWFRLVSCRCFFPPGTPGPPPPSQSIH